MRSSVDGTASRRSPRAATSRTPRRRSCYLAMNHERRLFGARRRRIHGRQRSAEEGREHRDRPVGHAHPARCVRRRHERPVHAADACAGSGTSRSTRGGPNVARRGLSPVASTRGGNGVFYCSNRAPSPATCQIVQANLRDIGLNMDIKLFPRAAVRADRRQWRAVRHDPRGLAHGLLRSVRLHLPGRRDDDPACQQRELLVLQLGCLQPQDRARRRPSSAGALPGVREPRHDLVRNGAPLATYSSPNDRHCVSSRVGCYHYHPVFTWDSALSAHQVDRVCTEQGAGFGRRPFISSMRRVRSTSGKL